MLWQRVVHLSTYLNAAGLADGEVDCGGVAAAQLLGDYELVDGPAGVVCMCVWEVSVCWASVRCVCAARVRVRTCAGACRCRRQSETVGCSAVWRASRAPRPAGWAVPLLQSMLAAPPRRRRPRRGGAAPRGMSQTAPGHAPARPHQLVRFLISSGQCRVTRSVCRHDFLRGRPARARGVLGVNRWRGVASHGRLDSSPHRALMDSDAFSNTFLAARPSREPGLLAATGGEPWHRRSPLRRAPEQLHGCISASNA